MKCGAKLSSMMGNCERLASRTYEGKRYCFIHDPRTLAAKADLARHRRELQYKKQQEDDIQYAVKLESKRLLRAVGLYEPTVALLRRIADQGGIEVMLTKLENKNEQESENPT